MYQNVKQPQQVNHDQYRTQNASINDISKKYGFDFSRDYASRQAEAEAQARRNQVTQGQRQNSSNLRQSAHGLDRDYFQQFQNQSQSQVNSGLNSGIASDQNLRLAMGQQAAMGGIYQDYNNRSAQLNDISGLIEQERLAREDSLYNDRLQQGFQNAMSYTDRQRAENQAMLQAALQQYGLDMNNYQWGTGFNRQLDRDKVQDNQWQAAMDWDKHQFNNLSAYQSRSLAEQAANRRASSQASSAWEKQYNDLLAQFAQQQYANTVQGRTNASNYIVDGRNTPDHRTTLPWRPQF